VLAHMVYRVSFARYEANRSLDIVINSKYEEAWMQGYRWKGSGWHKTKGNGITMNGTWVTERQEQTRKWLEQAGVDTEVLHC
jgi:hypothetical protein